MHDKVTRMRIDAQEACQSAIARKVSIYLIQEPIYHDPLSRNLMARTSSEDGVVQETEQDTELDSSITEL